MGYRQDYFDRYLGALKSANLVEENGKPHDWDDLQFESDVSSERVKRFRERYRNPIRNGPIDRVQNTYTETQSVEDFAALVGTQDFFSPPAQKPKPANAVEALDELFSEYWRLWVLLRPDAIAEDQPRARFAWNRLDGAQRSLAVERLKEKQAVDFQILHSAERYLSSGEYKRPPIVRKREFETQQEKSIRLLREL
jgi:hypothetical protein